MNLKDKLKTLPTKPGCYLMKDSSNTVIYVGKAINLKNRVNSYFIGAHDYKTTKLVSNIRDFDYIVVGSEKEALILEYNLIKKYDPKFNIVFKDDKSYPYIKVSNEHGPKVEVVRINSKQKMKGKLFGPYPDVTAARNTVSLLNKLFPLRKCKNIAKEVCLYYHIGECLGYCTKNIDPDKSNEIYESIIRLLEGDISEITKEYKKKMNKASEELDFEKAKEYRDMIEDLKQSMLKVDVQKNNRQSFNVFNYDVEDGYIAITGLFIEKGKLLSTIKHIDYLVGDVENYVTSYLYRFFELNESNRPLFVPSELLKYLEGNFSFEVSTVTRGQKYGLLKRAKENSTEYLRQNREVIMKKDAYYEGLANEFRRLFNRNIKCIELFDNSHTAGKQTVAAMVVYKNFRQSKKDYRLYKLEEGADDLKSMHEVLYRRYFRVLKDNLERPDLIIVDGGKIQIDVAKEVISSLGMDITIVGLGKDEHHNTSYLMDSNYNHIEIANDSNVFFFLTNMQDEVHRFAISYHKNLRLKAQYHSVLDDVKGIGPVTRKKLMKKYKTVTNLKQLTVDELKSELKEDIAVELYNKLHNAEEY